MYMKQSMKHMSLSLLGRLGRLGVTMGSPATRCILAKGNSPPLC